MHVVITGANGFVGRALTARLLTASLREDSSADSEIGFGADVRTDAQVLANDRATPLAGAFANIQRLTLVDLQFSQPRPWQNDPRVRYVEGSIAEAEIIAATLAGPVDCIFHLASIPGGAAERDYLLGRRINLDATLQLLEGLRAQQVLRDADVTDRPGAVAAPPPHFVFASSVAVYGEQLPAEMDEATLPAPALTYGAHKLIGEILVADATRLGWVKGCSLRLPGVVARPSGPSGLMSAFMSDLFWSLRDGKAITVPVSAEAVAWWISVDCCVENLIRAACFQDSGTTSKLNPQRSYAMPVLRLTMADIVAALARRLGDDRQALVSYHPDARIERLFGAYPPLDTSAALAGGLRHDGNVDALVERALAGRSNND